jgi:hypothetical protein
MPSCSNLQKKTPAFLCELSPCLSRACLGKIIGFYVKMAQRAAFSAPRRNVLSAQLSEQPSLAVLCQQAVKLAQRLVLVVLREQRLDLAPGYIRLEAQLFLFLRKPLFLHLLLPAHKLGVFRVLAFLHCVDVLQRFRLRPHGSRLRR